MAVASYSYSQQSAMKSVASASPIWTRVLTKFVGYEALEGLAAETVEIAAGTVVDETGAIALNGEFDRIEMPRQNITKAELAETLSGGPTQHWATTAYRIRNAILADGCVYAGTRCQQIAAARRRPFLCERMPEYKIAQLCADNGSDIFFGRWLCDSLVKEILAKEQGLIPINQPHKLRIHERGYRAMLQLSADMPKAAFFHDLWVIDDRGYNDDHVRRFRLLRERLRASVPVDRGPVLVYLARGRTGVPGRDLQNESELEAALVARGFSLVQPEQMNALEIAKALICARIVVGIEGSALAHAMLAMPAGGCIVTVQPSNRFSTAFKSVAGFAGILFAYVVAEAKEQRLSLNVDRLLRLLDAVDKRI